MTRVTQGSIRDRLARRDPVTASPAGRREAAVALLLAPGEDGLDLLLLKRAERDDDPWSGQMGLPGGRRDEGDHDLVATALRETHEEIGVAVGRPALIGQLDDLAPTIEHLPRMLVRPFVFGLDHRPDLTLSDEVALTLWVPLADLPGLSVEETVTVQKWQRRVSGFMVGPHLVWGMTERILRPFLGLVGLAGDQHGK